MNFHSLLRGGWRVYGGQGEGQPIKKLLYFKALFFDTVMNFELSILLAEDERMCKRKVPPLWLCWKIEARSSLVSLFRSSLMCPSIILVAIVEFKVGSLLRDFSSCSGGFLWISTRFSNRVITIVLFQKFQLHTFKIYRLNIILYIYIFTLTDNILLKKSPFGILLSFA